MMVHTAMEASGNALHKPVMLQECLDFLAPAISGNGAVLIDCTLGMGGHSEGALERFPDLRVIGIDRDTQAIQLASERLAPFGDRFVAVHTTYDHVADVALEYGIDGLVDGVLMDLGVSSFQLDMRERGFSYTHAGPLDMRMDPNAPCTAAELISDASEAELARIFRVYGEERFASRIAHSIVEARSTCAITTTAQLAELVRAAIPAPARRTGGNPAKRAFQALRIAVNDELSILEEALPRAIEAIRVGGRVVVEAYHSLEDRLVKEAFAAGTSSTTPAGLPMELEGHEPYLSAITKGALKAPESEICVNSRAQSVRVRGVERIRPMSQREIDQRASARRRYYEGMCS